MKTLLAALLTLALAVPAFGLVDDGIDSFGIYFDETGDANSLDPVAPNSVIDAYFIIANPTAPTLRGWEVFVNWGGLLPLSVEYRGMNPLDIYADMDKFIVGLAFPMGGGESYVLAKVTLLVPDTAPTLIHAGPAEPASIEGVPVYADGTLALIPMVFSTVEVDQAGWTVHGLAAVNAQGPVATESQSWSNVKALFE